MTKKEIIEKVVREAGISGAEADKAVNAATALISKELERGNSVRLRGFGRFSLRKVAARKCRHPGTGKLIEVPAREKVKFAPGGNLKKVLNTGKETA